MSDIPQWPTVRLLERRVSSTLRLGDQLWIVENVPARVNVETGEQFFSPATVERLQRLIEARPEPARAIETPVFDFAA